MHRIGVISDTHGLLREQVKEVLGTCSVIFHAGDINTPKLLDELKSIAPLYAVRGNVDSAWAHALPEFLSLKLYGINFFLIHNKNLIRQDISGRDIIIYGHSHKYESLQKGTQTWLNPGSCGRRRFTLPVTMAVITTDDTDAPSYQIERIDLMPKADRSQKSFSHKDMKSIVLCVMKDTDQKRPVSAIAKRNHISEELAAQICRLYVTHPGVSADDILKKMGL